MQEPAKSFQTSRAADELREVDKGAYIRMILFDLLSSDIEPLFGDIRPGAYCVEGEVDVRLVAHTNYSIEFSWNGAVCCYCCLSGCSISSMAQFVAEDLLKRSLQRIS